MWKIPQNRRDFFDTSYFVHFQFSHFLYLIIGYLPLFLIILKAFYAFFRIFYILYFACQITTKLKINGEFVNYKRYEGDTSDGSDGTMWVITDLTMTPQASGTSPGYKITDGANGTWTHNSDDTLKFVANGDFSKFTGVKVDSTLIAADKYTAASGSTLITLKKHYLDTLSVGKHTLTVVYSDGECSTEVEIKAAQSGSETTPSKPSGDNTTPDKPNQDDPKSPKTGDNSNLMLWIVLLFISGGVLTGVTVFDKRKRHSVK